MAKIAKSDHPAIRRMVETERLKVTEVAARFGCTPANIHAILGRMRRADAESIPEAPSAAPPPAREADMAAPPAPVADLFEAASAPAPEPPVPAVSSPPPVASPPAASASVTQLPRRGSAKGGVGGKLAKPGYGLCMRMADGEDSTTPFRSLEDLLSAIKPILRAAARNPEAVWFSVQPIDLSEIEFDAA